MLQFGQYKGKNLNDIVGFDYQYIVWIVNNMPNLEKRLDKEDFQYINKIIKPIEYIQSKYGSLDKVKEENGLETLKNEGLLKTAYQYIGNDGTLHYVIETIYGSKFGSISAISPFVTSNGVKLVIETLQLMGEYAKKHFSKYYKKELIN